MLFIPTEVDANLQHRPWMNWVIVGATTLVSAMIMLGVIPGGIRDMMVLKEWTMTGLLGHQLVHGGIVHLIGNMMYLIAFGTAICGNINNIIYLLLYSFFGVSAGVAHLLADGRPAVGASGAIDGIVGMAVAMYPLNRVEMRWVLESAPRLTGTFQMRIWILAVTWFVFDAYGAFSGYTGVAHWAHIGGFMAGLLIGIMVIERNWVVLGAYDNEPLLDILRDKLSRHSRRR
jgi:membrane associated rhomboid family serine protease